MTYKIVAVKRRQCVIFPRNTHTAVGASSTFGRAHRRDTIRPNMSGFYDTRTMAVFKLLGYLWLDEIADRTLELGGVGVE